MVKIGEGISRIAYQLYDNYIIKEAKDFRGTVCNVLEVLISNAPELADNPYVVKHYFYDDTTKFVIREIMTPVSGIGFSFPNDEYTEQLRKIGIPDLDNYTNWYRDKDGNLKFGDLGLFPYYINPATFCSVFKQYKCPFDL